MYDRDRGTSFEVNGFTEPDYALSGDGQRVAYRDGFNDIEVKPLVGGLTLRATVSSDGVRASDASFNPAISTDGRLCAFSSQAPNLVSDDSNQNVTDIFVHDFASEQTTRVSLGPSDQQGDGFSFSSSISGDGNTVVFDSEAGNFVQRLEAPLGVSGVLVMSVRRFSPPVDGV